MSRREKEGRMSRRRRRRLWIYIKILYNIPYQYKTTAKRLPYGDKALWKNSTRSEQDFAQENWKVAQTDRENQKSCARELNGLGHEEDFKKFHKDGQFWA